MVSLSESILNYVVNASWQTIAIVLVAGLGSFLLRTAPARFRHVLWLTALAACVIVPLLTATHLWPRLTATQRSSFDKSVLIPVPTRPAATGLSGETEPAPLLDLTKRRTQVVNTTSESTLLLLGVYALFIVWRVIRLVRFWRKKEKLRRAADLKTLSPTAGSIAHRCQTKFGVANIAVVQSSSARVPYTIGARRPLIVVPETFCTANDERLLSVIGHEMAHVARCDYLTNLICELIALPISFHPLTFVIKRQIDRARELACDELVSKRLLPPRLYARSLVWAADVSAQPRTPALMLTMFDARILEERVMRLTRSRKMLSRQAARAIASVALFALGASTVMLSLFS
ncbi:MAG TPA: M56 family metallopeptidase, partial [Pyrinomonadaceae bacterium]|nr:M56 family metallopeptidase [Pyrinomonadaceae bacterium]